MPQITAFAKRSDFLSYDVEANVRDTHSISDLIQIIELNRASFGELRLQATAPVRLA